MKKNTLGLAVATVLALSSAAMVPALAAGPAQGRIVQRALATPDAVGATRLIVKYKAGSVGSSTVAGKLTTVRQAASRIGLRQSAATSGRSAAALDASHVRKLALGADAIRLSRKLSESEASSLVAALRADASVEYAQVDRMMRAVEDFAAPASMTSMLPAASGAVTPQAIPNDPYFSVYQWHYDDPNGGINAPAAWDLSTGTGTVVAVLDTGILPTHPDLANGAHILPGYDFISDAFVSRRPTDDRVPGALDYGDWNPVASECYAGSPVEDSSWHGTHTAGTVGELTNNGNGGAGVG